MMKYLYLFLFAIISTNLLAQTSNEGEITNSFQERKKLAETSWLKNYPARNIGPTVQGGRIIDIDVNLKDTKEFYVAYASGGIFKTVNNGISFESIFDNEDALGVGDMALSQTDSKIIYVGTGEKNSSRSSYAGSGMYKTTNGGTTWQFLGLAGTQHISRIVIHPEDNNIVWVAALGALYSKNADRGIYKTMDGGKTWKKTLFVNDSTGIIDLVVNPENPDQLWSSSWEKSRTAGSFKGNGVGSSIYRSNDGGETWAKSVAGFPQGPQVGRIGLDVCASKPNVVYAVLDNQGEIEDKKVKKDDGKMKLEDFKSMSIGEFAKLDDKKLDEFLKDNGFPKKYNAAVVKKEIATGKYTPKAIAEYFGADANANLFNTKIIGAEVYRSDDSGSTWKKMNGYDLDGVFYTYGYYFSEIRVSPDNADLVYIYGVPMLKSRDGGVTWHRLDTLRGVNDIHVDHHAVWIDPADSKHVLLGNDGGLYQSYDEGANWVHLNNMSVGQFYTVNVDMETPYNVYGGLQDNGVLKGSSKSKPNETEHWDQIFGGDGMYVAPDPRDNNIVYTGYQFGNYYKLQLDKDQSESITPEHDINQIPFRFNWRTPLILSKHNADIMYMGSQVVHRSLNRGETWETISVDLTKNKKQGNVPLSTITSLSESPLKFGLLYAGTDDGNVWVSKNGGGSWDAVNSGLPADRWISSISPSPLDEATVFISVNGYRNDEFKTYLFSSADYGKTWKSIKGNLPESVANVVIQDPVNPDLLYCGLDNGTYVSFDKGNNWHFFNAMLNVSSYDMMVHPRDNELIVGTHGRSIFVTDVKPFQALKEGGISKGILAFEPKSIRFNEKWGEKSYPWSVASTPGISLMYFVGRTSSEISIEILDENKVLKRKLTASGTLGFRTINWDVKIDNTIVATKKSKSVKSDSSVKPMVYAAKGKYIIRFINGAEVSEVNLEIK
ncbi:MAG TPA: glycosyl hydrolase [Chryseolinea sp.]|nr:glycosyl hydrolase [Chryseolinea sp.]